MLADLKSNCIDELVQSYTQSKLLWQWNILWLGDHTVHNYTSWWVVDGQPHCWWLVAWKECEICSTDKQLESGVGNPTVDCTTLIISIAAYSDRALVCKVSSAWQVGVVGTEVGVDVDWEPVSVCVPDVVAAVVTTVGMVVAVCAEYIQEIIAVHLNQSRQYFQQN